MIWQLNVLIGISKILLLGVWIQNYLKLLISPFPSSYCDSVCLMHVH